MAPIAPKSLSEFPTELLLMVVELVATPLDDPTPLDQGTMGLKALASVSRRFWWLCREARFRRIRIWKWENSIALQLFNIYFLSRNVLPLSRSLSIRSIGPVTDIPVAERQAAQNKPEFLQALQVTLPLMTNLTELRLVTDNGRYSMEPVLRKAFDYRKRQLPTVKSLYVRTTLHMAAIFRCFPNLEAINFNLHGHVTGPAAPLSHELLVLRESNLPIRTLSILKTMDRGWELNEITALLDQFPNTECLFLEGSENSDRLLAPQTPKKDLLASAFRRGAHRNLRRLFLTDERWVGSTPHYKIRSKLVPANPDPEWRLIAKAIFTALPDLEELGIGRQADFKGRVFRPVRYPALLALAQQRVNSQAQPPQLGIDLIRSYDDAPGRQRLNFPPAKWQGTRAVWRPSAGPIPTLHEFAIPDDPVTYIRPANQAEDGRVTFINYREMVLDHCETGFWEVEWLRVLTEKQLR
ncbi:hypothetical protein C8A03DRAFT_31348 [Achaetomium macrosporum]|uniref:Uncharacterized protein n=1 Tax=Achaetomium macrosporum TaxID=79813 RepID=A0AAN7HG15_9PEZI|nr:hypothetical protein C8A03DRAFT_31348 [Achaetomium macrosporum]